VVKVRPHHRYYY